MSKDGITINVKILLLPWLNAKNTSNLLHVLD